MIARALRLLCALVLASCAPEPMPAKPALWEVTSPDGNKGWLFGTVHSLERPVAWRGAEIDKALADSGVLLVEVSGLEDKARIAQTFQLLARGKGLPPLSQRITPGLRDDLRSLLDEYGLDESQFAGMETWAAALTIAQAETSNLDSRHGIDIAVMRAVGKKPVEELEGAKAQLAIFDALPRKEQSDLLEAVLTDARSLDGESLDLAEAWRKGDMKAITQETEKGLLADPELRDALFTSRNLRWSERIAAGIENGTRPFVAVGAAHMAGSDGLPTMLETRGFTVRRVQ